MRYSNERAMWLIVALIFVVAFSIVRENPGYYPTLAVSQLQQCPVYQCDEEGVLDASDICLQKDRMNLILVNLKDCEDGMMCHNQLNKCTLDPYFKVEGRPNGATCDMDFMCGSKHCLEGECLGETEGASCLADSDCNIGLFCGDDVCLTLLKEHDQCYLDSQCENNLGCSNGQCLKYGSQEDYELSNNPLTCKSGFAGEYNYESMCLPTPVIVNVLGPDYKCSQGQNSCQYVSLLQGDDSIQTLTFDKSCQCGYSSIGSTFCPNIYTESYTQLLQQVTAEYASKCHTSKRLDIYECLMKNAKLQEEEEEDLAMLNEFIVQHYEREKNNEVRENDSCMKKNSLTSQYWDAISQKPLNEYLHQAMRSSGASILSKPSFYGLMFFYLAILFFSYK